MATHNRHDITTKDDVPLESLLDRTRTIVDHFNDASRPFRDMFVEQVGQKEFEELPNDKEVKWNELAEAEHPETVDIGDGVHITMRTQKFGQALHFTQERLQRENADRITRRVNKMLEGYVKRQQDDIYDVLFNGIADGSEEIWYTVDDYGEYTFSQTHSHRFTTTNGLFSSEGMDHPYDATAAQSAQRHVSVAADHLRHHDRNGPYICLTSQKFARRLKDEMDLGTQTYLPEARNLLAQDIQDFDIVVDNCNIVQTPWIMGDEFMVTEVGNGSPIKYFEEFPVRFTGPNGAPVRSPGDLIGAYAHANYGLKMVDPLGAVHVEPDNIA